MGGGRPRTGAGGQGLKCLTCLGLLACLFLPDTTRGLLDGLPLGAELEAWVLIALAALLAVPADRFAWPRPWPAWVLGGLLALLVLVRIASWALGDQAAPAVCQRSLFRPLPAGACEFSADSPWAPAGFSRRDPRLDFRAGSWRLGFLNTMRFDLYPWVEGNVLRRRLPVELVWRGRLTIPPGTRALGLEAVGQVELLLGGRVHRLQAYGPQPGELRVALPPGLERPAFGLSYRFDDGARARRPPPANPEPRLTVFLEGEEGRRVYDLAAWPLAVAGPLLPALSYGLSLLALAAFLAWGLGALARHLAGLSRPALALGLGLCLLSLFPLVKPGAHIHALVLDRTLCYLAGAWALVAAGLGQRRFPWPLCLASLAGLVLLDMTWGPASFGDMAILTAGNDWLVFDSLARAVLSEGSLRGGESVFYVQPFYRYWLAGLHLVFGDATLPLRWLETVVCAGLAVGLVRAAALGAGSRQGRWAAGLLGLVLAAQVGLYAYPATLLLGLAESLALILLLAACLVWARGAGLAWVAMFCGLAAITRFNLLPACLGLWLALGLAGRAPGRAWFRSGALLAAVLALPLLHNLYYGGVWVWLPTSGAHASNLVVRPGEYLSWPWGENLVGHLTLVAKSLSGIALPYRGVRWPLMLMQPLSCLLVLICLGAGAYLAGRGRWREGLLGAVPLLAWLPFLLFKLDNYYPRLVLAGSLLGGACLLVMLARRRPTPRTSPPGEAGDSAG